MPKKNAWRGIISKDIKIYSIGPWGSPNKKSYTLKPGHIAEAVVKPQLRINSLPSVSARSVLARLGVDVGIVQSDLPQVLQDLKAPERVMVVHDGKIPVKLRKGNRIHRYFFPQKAEFLGYNEIFDLKKSRKLVFGNDFRIFKNGLAEIKTRPVVYEIDPKKINLIAKKNWLSGSKKKKLMGHFRKTNKPVRTKFGEIVFTETEYVKLPKNVGLILQNTSGGKSVHTQSVLVDPGFKGKIFLELLGLSHGKGPDIIQGWFFKPKN